MWLLLKSLLNKSIVKIKRGNFTEIKGKIEKSYVKVNGKSNTIIVSAGARLRKSKVSMRGENNKLILEERAVINRADILFEGNNSTIRIGKNTTTGAVKFVIEKGNISLGNNCMLSYGIEIRNTDSHPIIKNGKRINENQDVVIKDKVWVGTRALILKGVIIGEGAIVGAGSVVTKEVRAKTIVAGNPAKQLKEGIEWKK